jgi:hypothetical protein
MLLRRLAVCICVLLLSACKESTDGSFRITYNGDGEIKNIMIYADDKLYDGALLMQPGHERDRGMYNYPIEIVTAEWQDRNGVSQKRSFNMDDYGEYTRRGFTGDLILVFSDTDVVLEVHRDP